MIAKKIIQASFALGVGPATKLISTFILASFDVTGNVFANIWLLDATLTLLFSFVFFSSDVYLTRELSSKPLSEAAGYVIGSLTIVLIGFIFATVVFLGLLVVYPAIHTLAFPHIDITVVAIACLAVFSANCHRIVFSAYRVLRRERELTLFSALFFSVQLMSFALMAPLTTNLLEAYYISQALQLIVLSIPLLHFLLDQGRAKPCFRVVMKEQLSFSMRNLIVEPGSMGLIFAERFLLTKIFTFDVLNTYAFLLRFAQPIEMASKLAKFILLDKLLDVANSKNADAYSKFIVSRRWLLAIGGVIAIFYPLIFFSLGLGDYFEKTSLRQIYVVIFLTFASAMSFYYAIGFFVARDFRLNLLADASALAIAMVVSVNFLNSGLEGIISFFAIKVILMFSLRNAASSRLFMREKLDVLEGWGLCAAVGALTIGLLSIRF